MASTVRDEIDALIAALSDGRPFSFFSLIGLIERYFADSSRLGSASDAHRERVRLRALPSLAFPPSDIAEAWQQGEVGEDLRICIVVTFLGLFGPASPLPPYYTEELLGDDPGQQTARDFLDLFNHRLISLVYKTWKKYRYYVQFSGAADDPFSRYIFALMGMQWSGQPLGAAIDWRKLMSFAGLIGMNCRSPQVMERILAHYFEVPVRIEEGVERIVMIPEEQQQRLGARRSSLGLDWLLGERLPDRAGKFRIWIGPVSWDEFQSFLPEGNNRRALTELVRGLLRDPLDFDVRVLLAEETREPWSLSAENPSRLGWSLFLGGGDVAVREIELPAP